MRTQARYRVDLRRAAMYGSSSALERLVDAHFVDADFGFELMTLAVGGDHVSSVAFLANRFRDEFDVNRRTNDGRTALVLAADKGAQQCVRWLVAEAKADTRLRDQNGMTALLVAVKNHRKNIVDFLLDHDPIANDAEIHSAFSLASSLGSIEIIRSFLERAALDLFEASRDALCIAAERGHLSVVKLLIEYFGLNPEEECGACLRSAIIGGQLSVARVLVHSYNVDLSFRDSSGFTALMYAYLHKHHSIIDFLSGKWVCGAQLSEADRKTIELAQRQFPVQRRHGYLNPCEFNPYDCYEWGERQALQKQRFWFGM